MGQKTALAGIVALVAGFAWWGWQRGQDPLPIGGARFGQRAPAWWTGHWVGEQGLPVLEIGAGAGGAARPGMEVGRINGQPLGRVSGNDRGVTFTVPPARLLYLARETGSTCVLIDVVSKQPLARMVKIAGGGFYGQR